jgi:hypothetical protein
VGSGEITHPFMVSTIDRVEWLDPIPGGFALGLRAHSTH